MEASLEAGSLDSPGGGLPSLFHDGGPASERRILGLSGYPGVGKDTVAKMLHPRGYKRIAFADPIRALAYDMDPAVHDRVDMWGWEKAKAEPDGYVRRYLQKLGERARFYLGPDIWIDAALRLIGPTGNYVVTDVRYLNEAERLRAMGGRVVRVERPGHGAVNDHKSEVEMDGHQYDAVLTNDGNLNALFDRVMALEEGLFA